MAMHSSTPRKAGQQDVFRRRHQRDLEGAAVGGVGAGAPGAGRRTGREGPSPDGRDRDCGLSREPSE
jgi:hypothetical protein